MYLDKSGELKFFLDPILTTFRLYHYLTIQIILNTFGYPYNYYVK